MQENLFMYDSPFRPQLRPKGPPKGLSSSWRLPNYIPGATAMGHAERDGVVPMGRVGFQRASVHDIEDSEEKALEQ